MSTVRRIVGPGPVVFTVIAVYAVAMVVLVLGPWGRALNRVTVRLYVFFRYDWPVAPDWALPAHYGLVLNVLLFVPLGAAIALLTRWAWWWVTLLGAVGSVAIEVVQGLWLARESAWSDVVTNTIGAFVGAVAVSLLARPGWRRAGRPSSPRRR